MFVWLAINNCCWTSDRLSKRCLPHQPACPLCDQVEETINHVLSSCVSAREVWTCILRRLNLPTILPPRSDSRFNSWWSIVSRNLAKGIKAGGADAGLYKDSQFEANYKKCEECGLPKGAYFYGKDVYKRQIYNILFLMKSLCLCRIPTISDCRMSSRTPAVKQRREPHRGM